MHLSIDISPEQHKRLKAAAALQGKSIKDYVLEKSLPRLNEDAELEALESFLKPRMQAAENGQVSAKSVDDIFTEVLQENKTR